jgi:uncharacterized membrane protein HdeD (DUF308 family)
MLMSPVPETESVTREDVEAIAKTWWLFAITGVLSVIAGVILLEIDWTLKNLAYFVGAVFIVRGIFDLLTPPMDGAPRTWAFFTGGVNIALGIVLLVWPEPTLKVIAALVGIWLLVSGIVLIVGAVANHDTLPLWGVTLAAGVLSCVLGVWALRVPGRTLTVIIVLVGIWAIVMGVLELAAAFEVKRLPKHFDKRAAAS